MLQKVCPGSLLSSKRAPDTGFWIVIGCKIVQYPGPWEQFELLLLNRSTLALCDIEKEDFFERWNVICTPS